MIILIFISILTLILLTYYFVNKKILALNPAKVITDLKIEFTERVYCGDTDGTLFSKNFKIAAKPDFIYRSAVSNQHVLIEYKSRKGPIQESDIAQVRASAIAAKSKYPNIIKGYIYTNLKKLEIVDLNFSEEDLANQIADEIIYTRDSIMKIQPTFIPKIKKCRVCGFNKNCNQKKNAL